MTIFSSLIYICLLYKDRGLDAGGLAKQLASYEQAEEVYVYY